MESINNNSLPRLILFTLFLVLVLNPISVWASAQCEAAKQALAEARDTLNLKNHRVSQLEKALEEAKAVEKKTHEAALAGIRKYEQAEAELKAAQADLNGRSWRDYDEFLGTETYQQVVASREKVNAARIKLKKAAATLDPLLDAADAAEDKSNDLEDELYFAGEDAKEADKDVVYWNDLVLKRCKNSLEEAMSILGFGDSDRIADKYKDLARNANQEDIAIEEDRKRGGTSSSSSSSSSSGTSTISINANCDVNSGSGTSTLSLNGSSFCSVTGAAPTFASGSKTITCNSGSTVTLSLSCTATNCRLNQTSLTPAGFSFTGINNGINGPFTGVTSFTGTCP